MNYGARKTLCALTILLVISPTTVSAEVTQDQVIELIKWRAEVHNAPVDLMLNVALCESRYDPNAVGKRGEKGIFQWLPGSYNAWAATSAYRVSRIDIQEMYRTQDENAVYFDIDAAAELFSQGYGVINTHWHSTINRKC